MTLGLLSNISCGEICSIYAVDLHGRFADRLSELGIYEGARVQCLCIAPSGTPIALWVNGTVIVLRKADCKHIQVSNDA